LTNTHYTSTAKILHWAIAGAIVLQFVLANLADSASDADLAVRELALLANHKSVGITILALALLRLGWRARNSPPALPVSMPAWQARASHFNHWALYGLIIAMPITGWLMSSASAYSVSWFSLFQLPDFVAPNPDLKETFEEIHESLAKVLFLVALLHILAALKHALVDKDGVLQRMLSVAGLVVFAVIVALGVGILGQAGKRSTDPTQETPAAVVPVAEDAAVVVSALPVWQIDYENSYILFVGDQAGAEFEGQWLSWSAELQFSPAGVANGKFNVTVNTAEVNTDDKDRDDVLSDPEWFDSYEYPQAYYRATSFDSNDDGSFSANGDLIIKGVSLPVVLTFTVEQDGNQQVLIGHAEFLRLDLGLGVGEWEDTEWVSNEVRVDVRVEAVLPR
jgi:cytochrome b561